MQAIETVRGPVAPDALGRTLAHEHVIIVTDWIQRDQPQASWPVSRAATIASVADKLRAAKAAGIDTIVDCTAMGHGRDVAAVAEANAAAEINIVLSTGVYTYDALPYFFQFRPPARHANGSRSDILADFFVREIREGIQGTGIRAALIKVATDAPGVTANIDRVLRAAAEAHKQTGAPITTHTNARARNGLDQQRVFREEGVDLARVVIGHSGDTDDFDYLGRLLDAGSYIGADRFGFDGPDMPGFDRRVEIVRTLVERGYEDQILISHDAALHIDWWPAVGNTPQSRRPDWRLDFIPRSVVPAMHAAGIPPAAIDKMLIANPRRLFTGR